MRGTGLVRDRRSISFAPGLQREYPSKQKQMFGYKAEDLLPEGHICISITEIEGG